MSNKSWYEEQQEQLGRDSVQKAINLIMAGSPAEPPFYSKGILAHVMTDPMEKAREDIE